MVDQKVKPTYEVIITFRVHAPDADNRDRVWLLGSLPELGEWIAGRAIETGQVEHQWKVFQASVPLPVESEFSWAWCFVTKEGEILEWEGSYRRKRSISAFSGTLHTAWGDPSLEIFEQNMASAQLMIQKRVKRADVMAVIGSSPTLGAWDPARAVIATEFPPRSGSWSATVFYDGSSLLEWNWVIINKDTKKVSLAEKRTTRFLHDAHDWIKLDAPWNKDAAVIDWRTKEGCGDNEVGTADLLRMRKERLAEISQWETRAELMRTETERIGDGRFTATMQMTGASTPIVTRSGPLVGSPGHGTPTQRTETPPQIASPQPIAETYVPSLKVKPYFQPSQFQGQASPPPPTPTPQPMAPPPVPPSQPIARPQPYPVPNQYPPVNPYTQTSPASVTPPIRPPTPRPVVTATFQESNTAAIRLGQTNDMLASREQQQRNMQARRTSNEASYTIGTQYSPPRSVRDVELSVRSPEKSPGMTSQYGFWSTPSDPSRTGTVDMTKAGYARDTQYVSKDGRQNLVSDPGRPGFHHQDPRAVPGAPRTSAEPEYHHERSDHTSEYMRGPEHITNPISPPVIRTKQERSGSDAEARGLPLKPAGSSTSIASTVGILGVVDINRKTPSLESLRQLNEQREQARTSERMKVLKEREERNKSKFEQIKKLAFMAPPETSAHASRGGAPSGTDTSQRASQDTGSQTLQRTPPKQP